MYGLQWLAGYMQLFPTHSHTQAHRRAHTVFFDFFSWPKRYPRTRQTGQHSSEWGKGLFFFRVLQQRERKIYGKNEMGVDVLIGAEAQGSEGGSCMVSLCCVDGESRTTRRRFHGSAAVFFSNRRIPLSPAWGETNTGSSYEGEFPWIYLSCVEKQQSPNWIWGREREKSAGLAVRPCCLCG